MPAVTRRCTRRGPRRLLPGEGELPLRELLEALPDGIPVAVEAPQSGDGGVGVGVGGGAGTGGRRRGRPFWRPRGRGEPAEFAVRARRALDRCRVLGPVQSLSPSQRSAGALVSAQARGSRSVQALRRGPGAARRQPAGGRGRGARRRRRQRRGQVDDAEDPVRRDLPRRRGRSCSTGSRSGSPTRPPPTRPGSRPCTRTCRWPRQRDVVANFFLGRETAVPELAGPARRLAGRRAMAAHTRERARPAADQHPRRAPAVAGPVRRPAAGAGHRPGRPPGPARCCCSTSRPARSGSSSSSRCST